MGHHGGAHDLRNLLSVAIKLRHFAQDCLQRSDRELYLMTAMALEARAARMAASLPQDRHDRDTGQHRPVDVLI